MTTLHTTATALCKKLREYSDEFLSDISKKLEAVEAALREETAPDKCPSCLSTDTRNFDEVHCTLHSHHSWHDTPAPAAPFEESRCPQGIRKAALLIAYDNGLINRLETEADFLASIEPIVTKRISGDKYGVIDKWLSALTDEQLDTVCTGEDTEADAILADSPQGTTELLFAIHDGEPDTPAPAAKHADEDWIRHKAAEEDGANVSAGTRQAAPDKCPRCLSSKKYRLRVTFSTTDLECGAKACLPFDYDPWHDTPTLATEHEHDTALAKVERMRKLLVASNTSAREHQGGAMTNSDRKLIAQALRDAIAWTRTGIIMSGGHQVFGSAAEKTRDRKWREKLAQYRALLRKSFSVDNSKGTQ